MTKQELAQYDGREGRPAYIAVNGRIYDVSGSSLWPEGDHQGEHQAGQDLTLELQTAPHVRAVIERFPVVGELEPEAPPAATGGGRLWLGLAVLVLVILGLWLLLR